MEQHRPLRLSLLLAAAWVAFFGCGPAAPPPKPQPIVTATAQLEPWPEVPLPDASASSFTGCFEARSPQPKNSLKDGFLLDLDGDQQRDLIALGHRADGSPGSVLMTLAADKGGGFSVRAEEKVPKGWLRLASGDFDEDGILDLVADDYEQGEVLVRLGLGQGRFARARSTTVGWGAGPIAVGDLNADGHLDLAVPDPRGVQLLVGDGRGAFRFGWRLPTGAYPGRPAVVDLDGDGKLDLLVASNDSHFLSVFLHRGKRLKEAGRHTCGRGGAPLAVGDFDGDGHADVAMGNVNSRTTCVFRGDGQGELSLMTELEDGAWTVAAHDLDGNGRAELLIGSSVRTPNPFDGNGRLTLWTYADGSWRRLLQLSVYRPPQQLWVYDQDADGLLDVVTLTQGGLVVLAGRRCAGQMR